MGRRIKTSEKFHIDLFSLTTPREGRSATQQAPLPPRETAGPTFGILE